jgi:nucleotide-binding universal stress UspA family protein
MHSSDLAILTQPDSVVDARQPHSFVEEAVLASARPLLVLPRNDDWTDCGRSILMAWDGSREATRAIVDALPLLRRARHVHLVGWHRASAAERDRLSARLASAGSWLKRHDVFASAYLESCDGDVALSMLTRATDLRCDLIVMGAYGPSRFGEHGAASVSRSVLAAATVPVMMSH